MRIAIVGASGRMGRMLIKAVAETPEAELVGAADRHGHAMIGQDAGEIAGVGVLGVTLEAIARDLFDRADVVIDFTSPSATAEHAGLAEAAGTALVIGTTGLSGPHQAAIDRAACRIPIVQAANMSIGVVLLQALVEQVASRLPDSFDIEILEMHHRNKVDAPSGTALALGEAAAQGRNVVLDDVSVRSRDGQTGPRPRGAIGFATMRGGDVVGDHVVVFAGEGERLELGHHASSRQIFASGALRAAQWVVGRSPGRYDMRDVLGF